MMGGISALLNNAASEASAGLVVGSLPESYRRNSSIICDRRVSADHVITVHSLPRDQLEAGSMIAEHGVGDTDLEEALLPPVEAPDMNPDLRRKLNRASALSWAVNFALLAAKMYAYIVSDSKAVLASAADSAVDLLSQIVISYTEWRMHQLDPLYPVGQARLEALGVLACACIMSVASFEVIQESLLVIYGSLRHGEEPELQLGLVLYVVLGSAIASKLLCYWVCSALASKSDSMLALAEDHLNDIMSNLAAVLAAIGAGMIVAGWWVDPVCAVLISLYIVWRWFDIARTQVGKIVGKGAPSEFVNQLEELANTHHKDVILDVIRAYHFGARYIVEMEVVMPPHMTVKTSHDISLALQHKVEALEQVERAFVHVDYQQRIWPEHKVERALLVGVRSSSSSLDPAGSGRLSHQGSSPEALPPEAGGDAPASRSSSRHSETAGGGKNDTGAC